ncbi:MAG TPA: tetratricopeptide repeat protein [Thermodesulfovibrionales bacterium]|nr:tetratricopeptide repeat protein [Thermodesulfovibrionales bacterium]
MLKSMPASILSFFGKKDTGSRYFRLVPYLIVILLIAAAYGGSLRNGFIWDDETFMVNNKYVHDISRWEEYFTTPESISSEPTLSRMYRPVQTLSFAIDALLWGKKAGGFHLTSLALHAACCAAIIFAFGLLIGRTLVIASAIIFAVHPALSEGVLSLSARGNQLYTLFSLLSLGAFMRVARPFDRNHFFCLATLSIALLSKEPAIALIALLPVLQIGFNRPWEFQAKQTLLLYLPLVISVALFLLLRAHVVGAAKVVPYWGGSLWATVQMQAEVFVIYLSLLVWPFSLQGRYVIPPPAPFPDPAAIGALLLNVILIVAGVVTYRAGDRPKLLALAIIWFYISLAPVSNIIPIPGSMLGERFIYFAFAGVIPLLAAAAGESVFKRHAIIAACCGAVVLSSWLVTDITRTPVWRDNKSFFTLATVQVPTSIAVQVRMAQEEIASKETDSALRRLEGILNSRSVSPLQRDMALVHYWYGRALLAADRPPEAYREFRISADLFEEPRKDLILYLAEAAARSGDFRGALSLLEKELKKSMEDDSIWNGMGNVYLMTGDLSSAASSYQQALRINPRNTEAASNLQFVLRRQALKTH